MRELYVSRLTSDAKQHIDYILSDGSEISMDITFRDKTSHWFIDLEYNSHIINNLMMVASDNLLEQWRNILPFTMKITSTTGLDPMTVDAWNNTNNIMIGDYTDAESN